MNAPTDGLQPLKLDRSRHAAPQVADALRELILALALPPGTVLQRSELAERYGVSQTPVRDALIQLGHEGLVDIFPQHATIVSRIDVAAAMRAHFLRRSLELEIVRELASRSDSENQRFMPLLREPIAQQRLAFQAQDWWAFTLADRAFHRAMYQAADLLDLWGLVRQRNGHMDRLRRLHLPTAGKAESVLQDHGAIADAIAARQPEAAQAALRAHLAGTMGFVDAVRQQHPGWVVG